MQYNWLKYFVLFYEIRFFTFDYKTTLHKKNYLRLADHFDYLHSALFLSEVFNVVLKLYFPYVFKSAILALLLNFQSSTYWTVNALWNAVRRYILLLLNI